MKMKLTEKQRRFVKAHYPRLSSREIARRLQVDQAEIDGYLTAGALTGKKRAIFGVVLFIVPFLVLSAIEVSLRIAHYGATLDLVVIKEKGGQKYYALNPEVGKRYFTGDILAVPEIYEESFLYQKPENGYRIFCLGGSTTASFPYELNARFHRLLHDRLATLFPDKTIEVINVGMSAVNSFTVLDFVQELVRYQPDLFLLYMGHNEFYGAFGVGSTQYLGRNRHIVKFYLWLQNFKTFQLLQNTIAAVKRLSKEPSNPVTDQTLMELMVRDKYIAFESEEYQRAAASFRENLTEIIRTAKHHKIGILVSTLVSNLKDHPPFHSLFSSSTTPEAKKHWENVFQKGVELEGRKAFAEALAVYQQVRQIDDSPSKLYFHIGNCHEALGQYSEALVAFQKARDLDALRFRASGEFNEIIRQICRAENVPVVEMEKAFAEYSPHGIVGCELINEHLHPNFEGYFLMAKTFCAAMADNNFISPKGNWPWQRDKTDEEYKILSGVTELDLDIGAYKIERLTRHWPFQSPVKMTITAPDEPTARRIRRITEDYSQGKISWNEAHYQLADYHQLQKQYARAEREYRAVLKVMPDHYYPYFKMGDLYLAQEKFAEAEEWFAKATQLNRQSPQAFAKLATVQFFLKSYEKTIANFTMALTLNQTHREFSPAETAWAEYYKAISHLQLGQKKEGMRALVEVLRFQPTHAEAKQLLALLQANAEVRLEFTK
ncbi:MAG: tetratricopeptide repeat protein [candidate division KSB1 bacterium]|nr:tetratricopeptide repeat protein [candidate division KSB1 bacterium]MDZ7301050.1 tetratricopeptide repeat protein [candidate division KSB1 bacterium]MDZ7312125.1 tetratricopeptide repeat protein [candidate division KSB1 bacterium]